MNVNYKCVGWGGKEKGLVLDVRLMTLSEGSLYTYFYIFDYRHTDPQTILQSVLSFIF